MAVALHILHDTAEAEDVVQIVFTEFYEKASLFDESKGNLRTWLLQYAYGRSFNQKRRLRRQTEQDLLRMLREKGLLSDDLCWLTSSLETAHYVEHQL